MSNTHRICPSDQLQEDQAREVVIGAQIIAIFRHEGKLFAMDGMCLHQGGPIAKGKVEAGCVTCPWHGWQYHLNSGNNAATGKPMLSTYPVFETNGWIEVELTI